MPENGVKIELSVLDTGKVRKIISLNDLRSEPRIQGISQNFLKVRVKPTALFSKLTCAPYNDRTNCSIRFLKRTHYRPVLV
jgi:hypothetical protein